MVCVRVRRFGVGATPCTFSWRAPYVRWSGGRLRGTLERIACKPVLRSPRLPVIKGRGGLAAARRQKFRCREHALPPAPRNPRLCYSPWVCFRAGALRSKHLPINVVWKGGASCCMPWEVNLVCFTACHAQ